MGSIYTHDEAAQIVELFETVLCEHGIRVPSPEDDERDPDNQAALYGSVYSDLLDEVEERLIDLLDRQRDSINKVVMNEFSGTW